MKLLIPLFISLSAFSQADRYLLIQHRSKAKEVVVQEGEFVIIKTFKGEKLSGRMQVLSESLIKVKHKVVPLTNVERIGLRNSTLMKLGASAFSMGVNLVFYGLQHNFRNGWNKTDGSYSTSAPFLAAGASLMWFSRKRTSRRWTFKGQMEGW